MYVKNTIPQFTPVSTANALYTFVGCRSVDIYGNKSGAAMESSSPSASPKIDMSYWYKYFPDITDYQITQLWNYTHEGRKCLWEFWNSVVPEGNLHDVITCKRFLYYWHFWWQFIGHWWIPLTTVQWGGALIFSVMIAWTPLKKQTNWRWFETPWCSCYVTLSA